MDLNERIARLIDPDAWETVARGEAIGLPSAQVFVNDSLIAARRVIDGLHLDIISSRHSFDGLRHRYDLTGFIREDA
jgi:hypothetical protein